MLTMCQALCSVIYIHYSIQFSHLCIVDTIIIFILHSRKLRLRKVE